MKLDKIDFTLVEENEWTCWKWIFFLKVHLHNSLAKQLSMTRLKYPDLLIHHKLWYSFVSQYAVVKFSVYSTNLIIRNYCDQSIFSIFENFYNWLIPRCCSSNDIYLKNVADVYLWELLSMKKIHIQNEL
jgi:hypothetical protein